MYKPYEICDIYTLYYFFTTVIVSSFSSSAKLAIITYCHKWMKKKVKYLFSFAVGGV